MMFLMFRNFGGFGCFGPGRPLMMLFGVIVVVGAAILIYLLLRRSPKVDNNSVSIDLLNERLVKGEITPEEYEKVKALITHSRK